MNALLKRPLLKLSVNKGPWKKRERRYAFASPLFVEPSFSGLRVWMHRWPVTNDTRSNRTINKTANEIRDSAFPSSRDMLSRSLPRNEWQEGRAKANKRLEDMCTISGNAFLLLRLYSLCKLSAQGAQPRLITRPFRRDELRFLDATNRSVIIIV